jgi:hypothetical protein
MTVSSREASTEDRRSHRSLARKLAWHHAEHEVRELTAEKPLRSSWFSHSWAAALQDALSGRLGYYIYGRESRQGAHLLELLDEINAFNERLYLIAPSLRDAKNYQHYLEPFVEFRGHLEDPRHRVALWKVLEESLWQFERTEQSRARIEDPPNKAIGDRDPFWESVPTEELILRHGDTVVEDPAELELELWESDQEFETFVQDIEEARRSDTI